MSETSAKAQGCFFGPLEVVFNRRFSAPHRNLVEQRYRSLDERSFCLAAAALMSGDFPSAVECCDALAKQEKAMLSLGKARKPSDIYYALGQINAYEISRWDPFWDPWVDVFKAKRMYVQLIKMDGGDTMTVPCRDPLEFKGLCISAGFMPS